VAARLYVSADGDDQAKGFDCEATKYKGGSRGRGWEEHERGNREKETGWHDQQSSVFHSLSLSGIRPMYARPPDPDSLRGPQTL
jgi:hypothetical protein